MALKKICLGVVGMVICMLCIFSGCSRQPTWQEQYDLGMRYLSESNYEQAIIAFTAAIEIAPQRAEAYIGRGDAIVLSGETAEHLAAALADYTEALERDETLISAWLGLADVYIRQGDYEAAVETLRQGLEKTGNDPILAEKIKEIESGSIYDSSGNIRAMRSYDGEGALRWYHLYSYDSEGNNTAVTSYNGQGSQTGHVDLVFDEAGRQLVAYSYSPETGEIGRLEMEYDENGRQIREAYYTPNGEIEYYTTKKYNDKDQLIRLEYYDVDGLRDYNIFLYDNEGQLVQKEYYYRWSWEKEFELSEYTTWEYDDNGRKIAERWFNADGSLGAEHFSIYDSAGNLVREDSYADGIRYITREYDGQGHMVADRRFNPDGSLIEERIVLYDRDGNYRGEETYDGEGNLISTTKQE